MIARRDEEVCLAILVTGGAGFIGVKFVHNWYLENEDWVASVESGDYRRWIDTDYGKWSKGKDD